MTKDESKSWFHQGLYFKCTGCGSCCGGSPGYVFLTESDEIRLAQSLSLSVEEFQKKYTRLFMGRRSLIEKKEQYDCIFLENQKCSVYESRPKQCRTYPFWSGIMENPENWEDEKRYCEGIESKDAVFFSEESIKKNLED